MSDYIDTILERIKARRSFSSTSLSLQEQSKSPIIDDSIWKTLLSFNVNDLERIGLTLVAALEGNKVINSLNSGNIIGSARLVSEVGTISVIIEPKVPAERLVAIIEFLQKDSFFTNDLVETYSGNSDILTLQVVRCLDLIMRSLSSGSIRGYTTKSSELQYIKGRADFSQFFYNSWPIGYQLIKCEFSDLTINTLRNQIFRLALVKISRVSSDRGQKELFNAVRMVLYSLSSVADKRFNLSEIKKAIRENPRDAVALMACQDVIFNLSISPHPDHARSFFSYSINMATLFEDYCHRLIAESLLDESLKIRENLIFPIKGLNQTIKLDGLYGEGANRVLIECKYKSIRSIDDVSRSDIYQCISYCCHADVQPGITIMLFPEIESDKATNLIGSIGGFTISSKSIHVVSVNLCYSPFEIIASLKVLLNSLFAK